MYIRYTLSGMCRYIYKYVPWYQYWFCLILEIKGGLRRQLPKGFWNIPNKDVLVHIFSNITGTLNTHASKRSIHVSRAPHSVFTPRHFLLLGPSLPIMKMIASGARAAVII